MLQYLETRKFLIESWNGSKSCGAKSRCIKKVGRCLAVKFKVVPIAIEALGSIPKKLTWLPKQWDIYPDRHALYIRTDMHYISGQTCTIYPDRRALYIRTDMHYISGQTCTIYPDRRALYIRTDMHYISGQTFKRANLSETKSRNFPCAAEKSHTRHVSTHEQNHLYISNDSMY